MHCLPWGDSVRQGMPVKSVWCGMCVIPVHVVVGSAACGMTCLKCRVWWGGRRIPLCVWLVMSVYMQGVVVQ